MRIYLETSVLVKLFKHEVDSDKMIEVISRLDMDARWEAFTSAWSHLEVARALKKDGKPKELIELNLKELRSHKIQSSRVTPEILEEAEKIISQNSIYASDSIHAATFRTIDRDTKLDMFLTDDKRFIRLKRLVKPKLLKDISI